MSGRLSQKERYDVIPNISKYFIYRSTRDCSFRIFCENQQLRAGCVFLWFSTAAVGYQEIFKRGNSRAHM